MHVLYDRTGQSDNPTWEAQTKNTGPYPDILRSSEFRMITL